MTGRPNSCLFTTHRKCCLEEYRCLINISFYTLMANMFLFQLSTLIPSAIITLLTWQLLSITHSTVQSLLKRRMEEANSNFSLPLINRGLEDMQIPNHIVIYCKLQILIKAEHCLKTFTNTIYLSWKREIVSLKSTTSGCRGRMAAFALLNVQQRLFCAQMANLFLVYLCQLWISVFHLSCLVWLLQTKAQNIPL